jgi:uncharacterized protein YndB with AHSA1/START domain
MTHELKIERLFDAPPELVFDTLLDPNSQEDIYSNVVEGFRLEVSSIDLRVGGTWTTVIRTGEGDPDRITSVFTEIERPHRLSYEMSMSVGEWGRTIDSTITITFEDQDGKTLLTIVQSGFETAEDRDSFESGAPEFLDALQKVVAARVAGGGTG